jgi:outer membrane receptor protein involved in Fe transport
MRIARVNDRSWRPGVDRIRRNRTRHRADAAAASLLLGVALCLAPAQVAAQSPLDGVARLAVDGVTVEQALQRLRSAAAVSLLYSPDLLPADRLVSCPCERVTVREALARILDGTDLTFHASGRQIRIVPARSPDRASAPAMGVVAGRLLAAGTGEAVGGAMVQLDDGRGVLSGADGSFLLRDVAPGTHRLRITSIGWAEKIVEAVGVTAGDTARMTVLLERTTIPLPAIVVAPGTFSLLEEVSPGAKRSLTREEIQAMPQVGEDVFRAMKRLPGVASSDISTKLNVRGGADSEVLVQLDGLELYEPYHMKDWDGAVGIIDLNALGGVELAAGGFGVQYGDRMAGVFDMQTRTSPGDARTTLGMSITNLTAMSRGGFDGGRGAWLASARQGFMGLVIRLIGEDERLSPQYYDVFGKVSWQAGASSVLTAHVLHAGDDFGLHDDNTNDLERVDLDTGWGSSYGWLTWDWTPSPRLSATTMGWVGRVTRNRDGLVVDHGRPGMPDSILADDDRNFTFAGLRHDLGLELSERVMLKAGFDARRLHADYSYFALTSTQFLNEQGIPDIRDDRTDITLDNHGTQVGAWLAARARPADRFTAEAGVRYDKVTHTGDENVAPRLLASLELGPRTTLRGSWGRYWQSHGIQQLEVGDGESEYYPAERSDQLALGIEHRLHRGIDVRLELYDRRIADERPRYINLEQDLRIFPEVEGDRVRVDPIRGRARGIELGVERREGGRWAWSVNYGLALAEDEIPAAGGQPCPADDTCAGRIWLPRHYDQRHTIDLQAAYRPGRAWNLSLAWKYHSGWPATAWEYDAVAQPDGRAFWSRSFGPVRGIRLPAYHRLDLRVTREFTVRGKSLNVFLDLFNLYNRTNIASWRYDFYTVNGVPGTRRHDGETLLPRLPMFGLRYEF